MARVATLTAAIIVAPAAAISTAPKATNLWFSAPSAASAAAAKQNSSASSAAATRTFSWFGAPLAASSAAAKQNSTASSAAATWSFSWFGAGAKAKVPPETPKIFVPFPEEPCKCLSWSYAYTGMEMTCTDMGKDICEVFYKRLNSSICMHGSNNREVCIVSSACKDLNGGMSINKFVSSKVCRPGDDRIGADLSPDEMGELAAANDVDIRTLMSKIYDTNTKVSWQNAKFAWTGLQNIVSEDKLFYIIPVKQSNRVTVFKAEQGATEDGVVKGDKAWEIVVNKPQVRKNHGRGKLEAPAQNAYLSCIAGCGAAKK